MKDIFLEDKVARLALMITMAYMLLYIVGALAGMSCGYPLAESLFESISASANVGLSCGITQNTMPTVLKCIYIVQMWAGRLEFMSVFTILGFLYAVVRGK